MMISGPALDLAICLAARTGVVGAFLFVLPPTGELPLGWQVGLTFLGWIIWCYWRGLFGRERVSLATVEAIPSLWLSLKWTQLLVITAGLATGE